MGKYSQITRNHQRKIPYFQPNPLPKAHSHSNPKALPGLRRRRFHLQASLHKKQAKKARNATIIAIIKGKLINTFSCKNETSNPNDE